MSNKHRLHPQSELEKEFELERLILFSDAVFAIAITLLVIDVYQSTRNMWVFIPLRCSS